MRLGEREVNTSSPYTDTLSSYRLGATLGSFRPDPPSKRISGVHVYIVPLIIVTQPVAYTSRQASSSHVRICHSSPLWAPVTGLAPLLLQSTTSSRRKICTCHRCSAGCAHALPRSIGRAQHTPLAPDPKIRLNRSPPAKILVTNSSEVDLHSRQDYHHIFPHDHMQSISTIQHGISMNSRNSGIKNRLCRFISS